ncbi:hypothetical protein OROHE_003604 [Orobanche hederae]
MQFFVLGDESETHIPKTVFDSESARLVVDSLCARLVMTRAILGPVWSGYYLPGPETASPAVGDGPDLSFSEGIFSLSSSAMVGDSEFESMVPATPPMEFDDVNDVDLNYLEWKEKYAVLLSNLYPKKNPDSRRYGYYALLGSDALISCNGDTSGNGRLRVERLTDSPVNNIFFIPFNTSVVRAFNASKGKKMVPTFKQLTRCSL